MNQNLVATEGQVANSTVDTPGVPQSERTPAARPSLTSFDALSRPAALTGYYIRVLSTSLVCCELLHTRWLRKLTIASARVCVEASDKE